MFILKWIATALFAAMALANTAQATENRMDLYIHGAMVIDEYLALYRQNPCTPYFSMKDGENILENSRFRSLYREIAVELLWPKVEDRYVDVDTIYSNTFDQYLKEMGETAPVTRAGCKLRLMLEVFKNYDSNIQELKTKEMPEWIKP